VGGLTVQEGQDADFVVQAPTESIDDLFSPQKSELVARPESSKTYNEPDRPLGPKADPNSQVVSIQEVPGTPESEDFVIVVKEEVHHNNMERQQKAERYEAEEWDSWERGSKEYWEREEEQKRQQQRRERMGWQESENPEQGTAMQRIWYGQNAKPK